MNGLPAITSSRSATLRSLLTEVRYAFRDAIPWSWLRILICAFALLFEASLFGLLVLQPPRVEPSTAPRILVAFFGIGLSVATATASGALARLLVAPERLMLLRLAPISERLAMAHLLAPAVVAGLVPTLLFALPFATLAISRAPGFAISLIGVSLAASAWAALFAMIIACSLAQRLGRARGAQSLRLLSYFVGFGTLVGLRHLFAINAGRASLALILATPVMVPPLAVRASRSLVAMLTGGHSSPEVKEPVWGSAGWGRTLVRSLAFPISIAALPIGALLLLQPSLRPVVASLCIVQMVAVPLDRLLEAETEKPERLRLAPEGAAYRQRVITICGGMSCALALVFAGVIALDGGRWRWFAGISAVVFAVVITFFVGSKPIRIAGQFVLTIAAIACAAFWRQ